jgi:hypothetical protein
MAKKKKKQVDELETKLEQGEKSPEAQESEKQKKDVEQSDLAQHPKFSKFKK